MTIDNNALVIGITGSIGSGCSTLAEVLRDKGFQCVSLSDLVRQKWSQENKGKQIADATRTELQIIGNDLRKNNGNSYLAKESISEIEAKSEMCTSLVIDSIRHPEEAMFFRNKFNNFFLITVDASLNERWERLKHNYEPKQLTIEHFKKEDKRDADEDLNYGQKVQLCVDDSDIIILNDEHYTFRHVQKTKIEEKIQPYLNLISGQDPYSPGPDVVSQVN